MKFLVIGCGSIGERHIRNLRTISKRNKIIAFDINIKRLKLMEEKYQVEPVSDLTEVRRYKIDGTLICTPPSSHVEFANQVIKYNIPLFIEKPISHNLEGVDNFIKKAKREKIPILVGYNLRFHPGLNLVKKFLDEKKIGKILSVRAEFGQYLPDWRPWQNYQQSYTAKKRLGGGIILDDSHEIDYTCWLFGEVKEVFCFADKVSRLKVETEDTAEILLKFETGIIANIHLDFLQRVYSRWCKIIGEKGTIIWNYAENSVRLYLAKTKKWQSFSVKFDPNDMYVEEMKHFIKCISGKEKPKVNTEEAREVLRVALASKESAKKKRLIKI